MQGTASTYFITREDIAIDPLQLITEGLQIGSSPDCELTLIHPTVARLHAGLKEVGGRFYIYNFSAAGDTKLNGRVVLAGEAEALAEGDVVQIGAFSLSLQPRRRELRVRVALDFATRSSEGEAAATLSLWPPARVTQPDDVDDALKVYWQRRKREEGKIYPRSPLLPQRRARLGKAQFNWVPTLDLVPPWPSAIITWVLLYVGILSFAAAFSYPHFFSLRQSGAGYPTAVSVPHLLPYRLLLYGAGGALVILVLGGAAHGAHEAFRLRRMRTKPATPSEETGQTVILSKEQLEKYDPDGPSYPHPVIITERCIGCHACVEACPHDVLTMINGIAAPVARDLCMEDTACQVECPVNPKACIVVNTAKKIPKRKVPTRDAKFMTNVPGCFIIGDVSGTPLIKNAANEGADVIQHISEELKGAQPEPRAELDVAIIGAGPAGLSAAVVAQQMGVRYVAVEQDKVLATIEAYPANKYVHFKPGTMVSRGGIDVGGEGLQRETIIESWKRTMLDAGARVNELESCTGVERAKDGDYFVVKTARGEAKEPAVYRARRVILALGNRGTPMELRVPGERLEIERDGVRRPKVNYRLADPEEFKRKKMLVVGAGNLAIEAAVNLVARRDGYQISYRPDDEINEVTLVIRSDFKNDVKFVNKLQVFQCIDDGKIKVMFGTAIKEIRDDEVSLMNARSKEDKGTIKNDFIFALIGGERPSKFLESIGITIG